MVIYCNKAPKLTAKKKQLLSSYWASFVPQTLCTKRPSRIHSRFMPMLL